MTQGWINDWRIFTLGWTRVIPEQQLAILAVYCLNQKHLNNENLCTNLRDGFPVHHEIMLRGERRGKRWEFGQGDGCARPGADICETSPAQSHLSPGGVRLGGLAGHNIPVNFTHPHTCS